jgi:hypothetical protein
MEELVGSCLGRFDSGNASVLYSVLSWSSEGGPFLLYFNFLSLVSLFPHLLSYLYFGLGLSINLPLNPSGKEMGGSE